MRRPPESEEIYERVGQNVAGRRREIGLSQTELAERCGLTRGSIAKYRERQATPHVTHAFGYRRGARSRYALAVVFA